MSRPSASDAAPPEFPAPPPKAPSNPWSKVSLATGLGLLFLWILGPLALVGAVFGVVTGLVGYTKARRGLPGRWQSIVGTVLSLVSVFVVYGMFLDPHQL